MARIARTIASCAQCRSWGLGKPVTGEGPPDARLVFVGEAPGKHEAATGCPFIGRAGRFLRQSLADLGLRDQDVFFLNAVPYLPSTGAPTVASIRHARTHLLAQLDVIRPGIVVLMGASAARAVLDRPVAVLRSHGPCLTGPAGATRYWLTVHPSAALRFPAVRRLFLEDLRRVFVL